MALSKLCMLHFCAFATAPKKTAIEVLTSAPSKPTSERRNAQLRLSKARIGCSASSHSTSVLRFFNRKTNLAFEIFIVERPCSSVVRALVL